MVLRIFVIAAISVVLTSAGISHNTVDVVVSEHQSQGSHYQELSGGYGGEYESGSYDGGKQYAGAELTSLAHSSAQQAKNAVQNQGTAGSQAAFGIKNTLASAALGAAQTAQAALVGKQAIVAILKKQVSDAQTQLQAEVAQAELAQHALGYIAQAAQQAQGLTAALASALASAQSGEQTALKAATDAGTVAASQQQMVNEAKQRLGVLLHQLEAALLELHETEVYAYKAAEAAQLAQSNAAAAGAAVVASSAKVQADGSGGYHHHH
ncbi:uncharacterized protein LOC115874184 [Sitophilus oryzae]|uniref:Uncharacterized protein LOC115874184 n=1 Tax=Sitophilus oryzae TaxID=7048 RepID=A0A6J2X2D5_SITOR|nr:uncharacterized protein LOC115874184 [Sitophilus oryzae]